MVNNIGRHRTKKILYVVANSLVGGVEGILLNTLKRLDGDKYNVTIVVTHMNGQLEDEFRTYSDNFISIACTPDIHTQDQKEQLILDNTEYLQNYALENDFDILHVINSMEGYHLTGQFHGKIIIGIYGDYGIPHKFFERRREILSRINDDPEADIITDTPSNLNLFHNAIVIPTGVDVPIIRKKIERNPKQLIWIGRASGEKRLQLYIDIANQLPRYRCVLFAAGRLNTFKIPRNMTVYHNITDRKIITEELRMSSMYINTSYIEGVPLSLIEAMKCKCIPIVPAIGGMPELIGTSGSVIQMRKKQNYNSQDIDDFLNAIKMYHRMMPHTMERQRRKVQRRVSKHSIEKMTKAIFERYATA